MTRLMMRKKSRGKKLTTMSVSIGAAKFDKFKQKCLNELNIKHTDVIKHLIDSFTNGTLVIDLIELDEDKSQ